MMAASRTLRRVAWRAAFQTSVFAWCVAVMVVPYPLVAGAGLAPGSVEQFEQSARASGLAVAAWTEVETVGATAAGAQLSAVTSVASAPAGSELAGVFYRRLQSYRLEDADGIVAEISETEVVVARQGDRVSLEIVDRFAENFDELSGRASGLNGVEIRRLAEFDMIGFDRLVDVLTTSDPGHTARPELLAEMLGSGEISYEDYEESVTVVHADGREATYPAGALATSGIFDGAGAGGPTQCTFDCFSDNGAEISFFAAVCIVSGAVVCAAGCAVTAGAACIPCLSAVSLGCGVSAAVGGIGICLAGCIFGVDPPTPTPRPTSTRTPTRTRTHTPTPAVPGDCDRDARTSIAELVLGVSILLGREPYERCTAMDFDGNGLIQVTDLIQAIRTALG